MSQSEELKDIMAQTLAREHRTRLMSMPDDERQVMVEQITSDIESASDFEIMTYLSENEKIVSTDVKEKIAQLKTI